MTVQTARAWFQCTGDLVKAAELELNRALVRGYGVAEARERLRIAKRQRDAALEESRAARGLFGRPRPPVRLKLG